MANLQREVQLKFRVTPEERALIEQKMSQLGTTNMAAYLRKMAIDGFVVNLELPELGELVSLLRGGPLALSGDAPVRGGSLCHRQEETRGGQVQGARDRLGRGPAGPDVKTAGHV